MRLQIKKKGLNGLKFILFLLLALPVANAHNGNVENAVISDFTWSASITYQTSDAISFGWSHDSGAMYYRCWYVRHEDNYTSSVTAVSTDYIDYTNLPAGTYDFYFSKVTSSGTDVIVIDDLIMG